LLGGVIPAFFWLWFWIREDRLRPEPKSALLSSFIGGIIAVLISLFFELTLYYLLVEASPYHINGFPDFIRLFLQGLTDKYNLVFLQTNFWTSAQDYLTKYGFNALNDLDIKKGFLVIIIAPFTEELFKLILTYSICLRRKINDEPIDASIYLLTAALGFAAVETAIFLTEPLATGNILDSIMAGNFRSIGPMLIHLISSAMLGIFIGLAFYKSKIIKFFYLIFGFILAFLMHAGFNFFIILNDTTHNMAFFWIACLGTWILLIILLSYFEKVKKVSRFNS
jgi:RsiW-degrading membrane proteinase PrsW (M82 family)